MPKWSLGPLTAAVAIASALPGCTSSSTDETSAGIDGYEDKEEVRLNVSAIRAMFSDNQIKGAQFFEHRTALIQGQVVRVREALGTGFLVLRSPSSAPESELAFDEAGTKQLGEVRQGDNVEATCPEVVEMMGQVIIACTGLKVL